MPQVSKYPLSKDIEERMFEIFWQSLAKLSSPREVKKFLGDLLSTTERTMLAKRLSIALLLSKGYDYGSIKGILKVSDGTIATVKLWLIHGGEGYKWVIDELLREEKMKEFWKKVEDVLAEVMPPSSTKRILRQHQARRKLRPSLG